MCFTILKFTWEVGARQNKAETLMIIYCGCGIELSFALGASWQSGDGVLCEDVRVKSSLTVDTIKYWGSSWRALVRSRKVWDLALSFAEVGTLADLGCPDAAEILKEGTEGAENVWFFHMVRAQEKCLSSVACGGNCV